MVKVNNYTLEFSLAKKDYMELLKGINSAIDKARDTENEKDELYKVSIERIGRNPSL